MTGKNKNILVTTTVLVAVLGGGALLLSNYNVPPSAGPTEPNAPTIDSPNSLDETGSISVGDAIAVANIGVEVIEPTLPSAGYPPRD